jgi:hypothetical protein
MIQRGKTDQRRYAGTNYVKKQNYFRSAPEPRNTTVALLFYKEAIKEALAEHTKHTCLQQLAIKLELNG